MQRNSKILIVLFIMIISAFALMSCSPAQPDEEEAKSMVMAEYDCVGEPTLEDSYKSDDNYTFVYNVKWTTPDNFINVYVPVSVYYFLDSSEHEWVYSYMQETGEETYSLNEEGIVGTWEGTGVVQTPALDLTNLIDPNYEDRIDKADVSLKINSAQGNTIDYELSIYDPLEGSEWEYSSEGSYQLYFDASQPDYYELWNNDEDPLMVNTLETRNWSGRHVNTTEYGFASYSYKSQEDQSDEKIITLKAYHGGEGKDIKLTKVSN